MNTPENSPNRDPGSLPSSPQSSQPSLKKAGFGDAAQSHVEAARSRLVPPSITISFVADNVALMKELCEKRGVDCDIDTVAGLAAERKQVSRDIDEKRAKLNKSSSQWQQLSVDDREQLRAVREEIKEKEKTLAAINESLNTAFSRVPNYLAPEVPIGPESANKVLRQEGEVPVFSFPIKDHLELAEQLDLVDVVRGAKVAGRGFVFLKGDLMLMRQALVTLFVEHLAENNYIPILPPVIADNRTLYGTGYKPWQTKDNYSLTELNCALIGTSEQPTVAQHMDEILDARELPLKYVAESQCFRTEAGSAGRDTRGMFRLHQFGKVEQIIFCRPEDGERYHLEALGNQEWLCKQLGLPYQIVLMASQDMAPPGYKKFDLEIWMPGQNRYRELGSHTNLTDFQARRLNVRFRDEETGRTVHPFTISATGFSDRILIGILENYQQSDGSIKIPEILRPLMRSREYIRPRARANEPRS